MYRGNRQEPTCAYTPEQVRRVIESSGLNIASEVDSDYIIFCPFHNNYRTAAAEVSKDNGMFFCFGCQESRTLEELVMFLNKMTYFQAARMIESKSTESDFAASINNLLKDKEKAIPFDELMIKRLHTQALDSDRAMRYYDYRMIRPESVKKFQLGYSAKRDMVTTPVHSPDGSMYLGFVGRSIEGKVFKNTSGNWRSKTLFNLHRVRKYDTVFVIESNFDAIRLDQNGVPAVATLGAYVSRTQAELLTKHFNHVIVIKDNDSGGTIMGDKMMGRMGNRVTAVGIPSRFKDVGDMTDEDIGELTKRVQNPIQAII